MTANDVQTFLENNFVLFLIALWTLPWKGVALWKAANLKHKWWFIAILVLNTFAILDILYIYVFSKKKESAISAYAAPPEPPAELYQYKPQKEEGAPPKKRTLAARPSTKKRDVEK